jgi:ATP-dependent helicase/nuclease subunit A
VLIETAEGLIIIDFKTDRLTAGVIAAKAAHYSPQMNLYAKAAAAIFPSRPIKKYLYFLSCGMAAKIA